MRRTIVHWILALTTALISCDLSTLVAPAAVPSPVSGAVETIVVQTAQAAATQTAALAPPTSTQTFTPVPSNTPTITPSPTPTFLFLLSTLTRQAPTATPGAASGDLSCQLVDQTPADGSTMSKNQSFSASWTVWNTGTATWDSNAIDFVYVSGAKLTSLKAADLPKTTAPGDKVTLKLTMLTPSSSGTYKTVWTLEKGKNSFCRVSLSVVVK